MAIGIVPSCGFLSGPSDMQRMTVAMVVHLVLSVLYGLLFGWLAHRLQLAGALLAGAAFGLIVVYAVNFYLIAPLLFPWFADARNMISLMTHVLFGLVLAGAYVGLRRASR